MEPGAGIARRRLAALLQRLDRWLDRRPEVVRDDRGHTVWVFGAIGYRVDRHMRAVYPVLRNEEGRVEPAQFTMELFRPLATQHFLPFVLRHLGLSDAGRQKHLFRGETTIVTEEYRISLEAYPRLLRDSRFRELRARYLPAALALDPVLSAITLQARRVISSRIASDQYTFVWRHEKELRAVAREDPGLLPLAAAALDEGWILPCGDAVKELNLLFREKALAPATWRYVARHGSRFLRTVWTSAKRGHLTSSALEFLREIERAGHPAPPPSRVLWAWLFQSNCGQSILRPDWNPVPPEVVRICLAEARRVRGTADEGPLWEDLRLVLEWAGRAAPQMDKLQKRAGWPWLLRQAHAEERRRMLVQAGGASTWPCALREFECGEFLATAVVSVEGLVDEGRAFHNCIADYVDLCQNGTVRIFVVRERVSGRRVGVSRLDHGAKGWVLHAVLGTANTSVGGSVQRFARHLAERYQSLTNGGAHKCVSQQGDFGCALFEGAAGAAELLG